MKCRFCNHELSFEFIDLVNSPPSNSYLSLEQLNEPEVFYPLKLYVCDKCYLVQIDEYKKSDDIFNNQYAYFSSYSSSWLKHSEEYVDMISKRLNFDDKSQIYEIASNDGYLLQYFKKQNINCIGIEPTANTAKVAIEKGIETIVDFFGKRLASKLVGSKRKADLIIGNNVLAHVPDINDFVGGLKILLQESGTITMEFPHLLQLIKQNQFDTIYHEHFSYLSLYTVKQIFEYHQLCIYDVEELKTHGGSLRIFATHINNSSLPVSKNIATLLEKENRSGLTKLDGYKGFQNTADTVKYNLLNFLIEQKLNNKIVAAYGAAAKGNTLLNYCGVKKDLISFVVDKSPHKQNKFLPGSHIPIVSEEKIKEIKPEYVIILPWNIKEEIIEQLNYIEEWGGKFVVAIPNLKFVKNV